MCTAFKIFVTHAASNKPRWPQRLTMRYVLLRISEWVWIGVNVYAGAWAQNAVSTAANTRCLTYSLSSLTLFDSSLLLLILIVVVVVVVIGFVLCTDAVSNASIRQITGKLFTTCYLANRSTSANDSRTGGMCFDITASTMAFITACISSLLSRCKLFSALWYYSIVTLYFICLQSQLLFYTKKNVK